MSGNKGGSLCKRSNSTAKIKAAAKNQIPQRKLGGCIRTCDFNFISPPMRYLKRVGGKVAAVVMRITTKAKPRHLIPPPPRTSVAPIDSQREEAIHDCIDFIKASAALPRSNSVAADR